MKLVVFGLTVSSSWGNGHATLWRGLINALAADGHRVDFFERDVPWYAAHRDPWPPPQGAALHLYRGWEEARPVAIAALADADVAIVTSYCPDALQAEALVFDSGIERAVFYDLDTPVTFERLAAGQPVPWIGPEGLAPYDLVLSFTGGPALEELRSRLGARRTAPLYGSVDPAVHHWVAPRAEYRSDLSYMGTWARDRQAAVSALFLEPAARLPGRRFLLAGAQYPADYPWRENVWYVEHLAPADHPAFYSSSALTLNVTRGAMAAMGWCPSGRLFEAAACGTPVLSDWWPGIEQFFEPGREILLARRTDDALEALALEPGALREIAHAARERVLAEHSAQSRARELVEILELEDDDRGALPAPGSGLLARGDEHVGHRSGRWDR